MSRLLPPAPIQRLADKAEGKAARAFLQATERQRAAIHSADDASQSTANLTPLVRHVDAVYWASGQMVARQLTTALSPEKAVRKPKVDLTFDTSNPKAVAWAKKNGARLVRETTAETKAAIRRIIADALDEGGPPKVIAKAIRSLVGLTRKQVEAVIKRRADLREEGRAADQVARMAEKYAAQLLKRRAELIARTELSKAANGGQQQLWLDAQEKGLLPPDAEREWIATDGACDICGPLDGETAGLDEPWESEDGPIDGPPAHPACRCAEGIRL